ncbi:hypothetical protein CLV33_104103 [Jejuia pallidilutea]|uniref:DUF4129 domain-containing protein n=1 Tax=Jejuia pallidilutea TaxID=504487 RepID=A0A362X0I5_9FLAO|nr:hypothetical protein [Jejuia pallidilutea]PQV48898.1 hypothetical protein CLV33_104103 [Jejuia pallidilutea]
MKPKALHICLSIVVLILNYQTLVANSATQEPQVYRVFDSNFKERYASDKYNYEGKKVVGKTRGGSGTYEDYDKNKTRTEEKNNADEVVINLGPFGFLFYIILAIAVVYLAYVLLNEGGTGLFAFNKNKSIQRFDEITAENIEHADINSLIKEAENNNDYRLAIRYYYLLVLKTLSLKNHIKFEDDKTNTEYLNELNEKPFSKNFSYVSYLYNYIWYGKFNLEASQYAKAKLNFTTLLNQVN